MKSIKMTLVLLAAMLGVFMFSNEAKAAEAQMIAPSIELVTDEEGNFDSIVVTNKHFQAADIRCGIIRKDAVFGEGYDSDYPDGTLLAGETTIFSIETVADYALSNEFEPGEYYFYALAENEDGTLYSEPTILESYPVTITENKITETTVGIGDITSNYYFTEFAYDDYSNMLIYVQTVVDGEEGYESFWRDTIFDMFCIDTPNVSTWYDSWTLDKIALSSIQISNGGCEFCWHTATNFIYETYEEPRVEAPTITLKTDEDGTVSGIIVQNNDEEDCCIYYGLATQEEMEVGVYPSHGYWLGNEETKEEVLDSLIRNDVSESGEYYLVAYADNGNEEKSALTVLDNYPITFTKISAEEPLACQVGDASGSVYFTGKTPEEYSYAAVNLDGVFPDIVALKSRNGILFFDADDYYSLQYNTWVIKEVTFEKANAADSGYTLERSIYTSLEVAEESYEELRADAPAVTLLSENGTVTGIEVRNDNEEHSCVHYGFLTKAEIEAGDLKVFYDRELENLETYTLSLDRVRGIMSGSVWFDGAGEYYFMAYTHSENGARSEVTVLEEYPLIITENLMDETLSYQVNEETGNVYFIEKSTEEYFNMDLVLQLTDEAGNTESELCPGYKSYGLFYFETERYNEKEWSIEEVHFGKFAATDTGFYTEQELYTSFADDGIFIAPKAEAPTITLETDEDGTVAGITVQNTDAEYCSVNYGLATREEIEEGVTCNSSYRLDSSEATTINIQRFVQEKMYEPGEYYFVAYAFNGDKERSETVVLEDYPFKITETESEENMTYQIGNATGYKYFANVSSDEYDYATIKLQNTDEQATEYLSAKNKVYYLSGDRYADWSISELTLGKINAMDTECNVEQSVVTSITEEGIYDEKSGVIDEEYGQITWKIDSEGKLTVTGTGDVRDPESDTKMPWYEVCEEILTAEIDVTGMTDASDLFYGCSNMTDVDLSDFDTSNVTDMELMFSGCEKLENVDIGNFDTNNVTNMGGMFQLCFLVKTLDVSNFDTSNVTTMSCMFYGCESVAELDVSGFITDNVTDMAGMFGGCRLVTELDLSGFNTEQVTVMRSMFWGCSSLEELNLSNFDTRNVTNMYAMFESCDAKKINLSSFDMENVTDARFMFWGSDAEVIEAPLNCNQIVTINYNAANGDKWYLPDGTVITTLPQGLTESVTIMKNQIPASKTQDQWKYDGKGWWYSYATGGYPANCWKQIDGKWYWFDTTGYMKTGWLQNGGYWYYLSNSGAMVTGWAKIGGSWYYFNQSGTMVSNGWLNLDNQWYYLNSSGAMVTGWLYNGGQWYYMNASGQMCTDWVCIGNQWYYLRSDGVMVTGWLQLGTTWYYLQSNGVMAVGRVSIDGRMNAFNGSGVWLGYI